MSDKHIFEFVFKKKGDDDIEVQKVLYGTEDTNLKEQTVKNENQNVDFENLLDNIKQNGDNFINFTIDDVKPKSGTESAQTPGTEPAKTPTQSPTSTSASTPESTPREIQE
jgi:hypothetical protein